MCSGFIFVLGLLVGPYSKYKMKESFVNHAFHRHRHHGTVDSRITPFKSSQDFGQNNIALSDYISNRGSAHNEPKKAEDANVVSINMSDNNADLSLSAVASPRADNMDSERASSIARKSSYCKPQSRFKDPRNRMLLESGRSHHRVSTIGVQMQEMATNRDFPTYTENQTELKGYRGQNTMDSSLPQDLMKSQKSATTPTPPPTTTHNSAPKLINVGCLEFLLSSLRHRSTVSTIDRGSDHIMSQLDYSALFLKLTELDRLKQLLLTDDQRVVFESVSKPSFSLIGQLMNKRKQIGEEGQLNVYRVREAYERLKKREEKTRLDSRLVEAYEENPMSIEYEISNGTHNEKEERKGNEKGKGSGVWIRR